MIDRRQRVAEGDALGDQVARRLDGLSFEASQGLGFFGRAVFHLADDIAGEFLDWTSNLARPSRWPDAVERALRRTASCFEVGLPWRGGQLARQEWRNKLAIFGRVRQARQTLDLPTDGRPYPLRPYVERAYRLPPFETLWTVEGLGHDFVWHRLASSTEASSESLLGDLQGIDPPALAMLHAGLGLAAAEYLLEQPACRNAVHLVQHFVELCQRNCLDEHLQTALEALGLVTRCFHPERVSAIDLALHQLDDSDLRHLFWHGVGRAHYFLPAQLLPGFGSLDRALDACSRESPDGRPRRSAMAGLGYAFTLVNMAHPEILEHVVLRWGSALQDRGFSAGSRLAVRMRRQITPGAPEVEALLAWKVDPRVAGIWRSWLEQPDPTPG